MEKVLEKSDAIIRQAISKSQHIEREARKRADALIDHAIERSRIIFTEAEKKGYDEGYAKGLAAGEEAAFANAERGMKELQELAESIKLEEKAALDRQEKDLIKISMEIAKKILKKQAAIDPDILPDMLSDILEDKQEDMKIYLSEYNKVLDLHIDKNIADNIQRRAENVKVVIVHGDDLIAAETQSGVIDLNLTNQLEQLENAMNAV